MDLFIKDAIEELKKNTKGKDIDEKSKKKIYELFPIPREHKILWADNVVENKVSGMVITDIGVFFKSNPSIIKSSKRNCEKKEKISSIYHFFIRIIIYFKEICSTSNDIKSFSIKKYILSIRCRFYFKIL